MHACAWRSNASSIISCCIVCMQCSLKCYSQNHDGIIVMIMIKYTDFKVPKV